MRTEFSLANGGRDPSSSPPWLPRSAIAQSRSVAAIALGIKMSRAANLYFVVSGALARHVLSSLMQSPPVRRPQTSTVARRSSGSGDANSPGGAALALAFSKRRCTSSIILKEPLLTGSLEPEREFLRIQDVDMLTTLTELGGQLFTLSTSPAGDLLITIYSEPGPGLCKLDQSSAWLQRR